MTVGLLAVGFLSNAVLESFGARNTVGVEIGVVRVDGVYALSVIHHVYRVQLIHLLHEIGVDL